MNQQQVEMLVDLNASIGKVYYDCAVDAKDKAVLKQLQLMGFVEHGWMLTPKGEKKAAEYKEQP